MRDRSQTQANLEHCFDELEGLLPSLTDDQWATQSLCPDWDVRGVVCHLAGIEYALAGWQPEGPETMPPFERVSAFLSEVESISNKELIVRVDEVLAGRRVELHAMSDEAFSTPTASPIGVVPYGRFMDVRVFDFWVHQRDITTPLGIDTPDGGPTAESSLDEIEASIGYIVGKGIGLPEGLSIRFDITGPAPRTINVVVDGRATAVDSLTDPSVTLTTDTLTFVQLACGRIDPSEAIEGGRVSWTGEDTWGKRAATSLRFTR